ALTGLLLGTLLIAVAAAGTDTLLPESVRPMPTWLAGPFAGAGVGLGTAGLIAVLALMFGCYVVAVYATERLSARVVLMGIGAIALVYNAARMRGVDQVKAAALVGLNPLVVVYGVGGGHNDLLMLLLMIAGVYLVLANRERWGSATMIFAAAIKVTGALPLAFAVAAGGGRRARNRRRDVLIGAGVAAALMAALGFAWFGTGPLHLPATIQKVQSLGDWQSIPGFIGTRLGLGSVGHVTGFVLDGAFVAALVWLLREVWHGELDWIDASA